MLVLVVTCTKHGCKIFDKFCKKGSAVICFGTVFKDIAIGAEDVGFDSRPG